ncbi:MAG TPA: molybdate ABC transporter substrate-binding protein [Bacteroidales bacterium]|nr:molybdate ABC transporter substrate-binding protein [Bacteroidales bacterium]
MIIILTAGSCKPGQADEEGLMIATAANMQFAMKELVAIFTLETGVKCHLILSSSGKLTAQIKEGAPYDLFVSADVKYPMELFGAGLADSLPRTYALGKLVLWTMTDTITPSMSALTSPSVIHVALANPKTAPYGVAAMQALEQADIFAPVSNKLVYGESIAQTNQFIITRSAEIGFTAMSVVLSPAMNGKGRWSEVDPRAYTPIKQGVVLIKHGRQINPDARKFYDFLFSSKAKEILKNFGYSVNE